MSIEDISYLLDNSAQDSSFVFVDSHDRDMQAYPAASSFVVKFDEPYRLVYGFEVLDAAVPAVMYSVDVNNDSLAFTTYSTNDPPITLQQLMSECWDVRGFDAVYSSMQNSEVMVCTPAQWTVAVQSGLLSLPPPADFTYLVLVRTPRPEVVLLDNATGTYTNHPSYAIVQQATTSVAISAVNYPDVFAAAQAGRVVLPTDGTSGVIVYDVNTVDSTVTDVLRGGTSYMYDLYNNNVTIERGNYDINTLLLTITGLIAPSISVSSSSSGNVEKASKYLFKSSNPFFLDMNKSTCRDVLGFATLAQDADAGGTYAKLNYGTSSRLFASVVNATNRNNILVGPGVINVSGVRYIILRCPEIEDHMQLGKVNPQNTPGIGMFKLAGGNDVTHLRFDYVSLVRKPFHPIGKLSRLTLRFELPDGGLYDFKGTDMQLLINLKYYVPGIKNHTFQKSVLNPEYDPDFFKYIGNQLRQAQQYRLDPAHDDARSDDTDTETETDTETDSEDSDQGAATRRRA